MSEEIKYDLNMQVSTTDNDTWFNSSQTLLIDGDSSDEAENAAMILSNHSALTELLHLKELECEQLAKDKTELVDALIESQKLINTVGDISINSNFKPAEKSHRMIKLFEMHGDGIFLCNKQLLERLG